MATDVHMSSSLPFPAHTNGATDTEHEIHEYQKIIMLRNEIYAGNNPRFKPASQPGSVSRSTPQTANPPSGPSADKNRPALPLPLCALRGQPQNRSALPDSIQMSESEIKDILLAKSEILVSAEIKLKRQRIEKELKRQLEEKRQVIQEEDLNLEEVMEKAGLSAKTIRPEEPTQEDVDMQTGEPAPRRQGVQEEERAPDVHVVEASRGKPPPTGPAAMSASRDQEMSSRDTDADMKSYNGLAEHIYSPPARPRYSATSQLRSPAAPQPVRPANMARVESQDQRIIEVDDDDGGDDDDDVSYGRYSENAGGRAPYRSRASPVPYIKPEPGSPGYRVPAPRGHTPGRSGGGGGRPQSRPSQYDSGGRTRYEYPYVPPTGYYPPHAPPQVPTHRPYDPHAHREADPYAYPPPPPPPPPPPLAPVDYTHRPYTSAYVPPVASVYPPRPVYDDYDRRYALPPAARQPSRIGRRSASPPTPYRHARHPTSSLSPPERVRREALGPPHAEYRQNRARTPPRVDNFGRPMPPPPQPLQQPLPHPIYTAEYAHTYPPAHSPREGAYGDRGYYPPRYDEPPRVGSSTTAREADLRSYRDREYYATAARSSLPPPPPIPGSGGYAPLPPFDYTRAPSRAPSRTEYHGGREREWNDHRALPDERTRESDYVGRTSVRQEERAGGYLPVRHPSVRSGYGEREYAERRREGSRERYVEPPPPPQMMGGFGERERERMMPPRDQGYEGYGERYGGRQG
ncbi:hypothetical protein Q9L58_002765 [Maublancomyces gigas]|uniref:Uncharacterized protein n=1 Tax=Discina gigas TaxID=1032678 RepID=A0ABR3GQF9_9PEZI